MMHISWIQRQLAWAQSAVKDHAEIVAKWETIFCNQPYKLKVARMHLDEQYRAKQRKLVYWQGMLADWSQS